MAKPRTNPCTNCGQPVLVRRPSRTGNHWCKNVICQRERTKFYRKQPVESAIQKERRATSEVKAQFDAAVQISVLVLTQERIECPTCNVADAVPTLPHPDTDGGRCLGTANPQGASLPMPIDLVRAIWPRIA